MTGLVTERDGAVSVLRIDRPDARNALTPVLLEALGTALIEAESDPGVRAVVLTGTGDRVFSAGLDLRAFAAGERMTDLDPAARDAFERLLASQITVPVIGAANGTAVAGGLELLLGCDIVVAASGARFGFPEVKRGLFPGGNGTALGRRVPVGVALELLLTGDLVEAERAERIGLVNHVVEPSAVLDRAIDSARRIAANAPLAVEACRELVRLAAAGDSSYRDELEVWQRRVFDSDDAREGAAAFVEKRDPVWTGR